MSILRNVLLAGSQNTWLREHATRYRFVRNSVSRFMPGEEIDDALKAARELQGRGVSTILTQLGENLTEAAEADEVELHYLEVLRQVQGQQMDAQISIKPTQLGLDLDAGLCLEKLHRLVAAAGAAGNFVWIDMESTPYVDATLELYRKAREKATNVGVCLQSYLYRTAEDLEKLIPMGPAIRMVKGAYKEPPDLAYPRKQDVDDNFFKLCVRLLQDDALKAGAMLGVATHDPRLIERVQAYADGRRVPREAYEYEMLFGIQRRLQQKLVDDGRRLRVLISYGAYWFPWYVRRLAERPANVLFLVRNLFS